jgi:hypothetical protein
MQMPPCRVPGLKLHCSLENLSAKASHVSSLKVLQQHVTRLGGLGETGSKEALHICHSYWLSQKAFQEKHECQSSGQLEMKRGQWINSSCVCLERIDVGF